MSQYEKVARTILDAHRLKPDQRAQTLAKYLLWADRALRSANEDCYQNELANIRHLLGIPSDASSDEEPVTDD